MVVLLISQLKVKKVFFKTLQFSSLQSHPRQRLVDGNDAHSGGNITVFALPGIHEYTSRPSGRFCFWISSARRWRRQGIAARFARSRPDNHYEVLRLRVCRSKRSDGNARRCRCAAQLAVLSNSPYLFNVFLTRESRAPGRNQRGAAHRPAHWRVFLLRHPANPKTAFRSRAYRICPYPNPYRIADIFSARSGWRAAPVLPAHDLRAGVRIT